MRYFSKCTRNRKHYINFCTYYTDNTLTKKCSIIDTKNHSCLRLYVTNRKEFIEITVDTLDRPLRMIFL